MDKIFITGSTEGLGLLTAKKLIKDGNEVVLHARNQKRLEDIKRELPNVKNIVVGDLSVRSDIENIAKQVNALGTFDTVIYNAGVNSTDSNLTFKVNDVAPYLLTALINTPKRIIYISSGMHKGASLNMENLAESTNYSSSKLQLLLLMKGVDRLLPQTTVTAVDPGWVPTRMGGTMATDDLTKGYTTQLWLATLEDPSVSGKYFYHLNPDHYDARANDVQLQDEYLNRLAEMTNVKIENQKEN